MENNNFQLTTKNCKAELTLNSDFQCIKKDLLVGVVNLWNWDVFGAGFFEGGGGTVRQIE